MDNILLLYYVRDGMAFVGVMIGLGMSGYLLTEGYRRAGLAAGVGFLLLAIEPAADLLIWQILSFQDIDFDFWEPIYALAGTVSLFGGAVCLAMALSFLVADRKQIDDPIAEQMLGQYREEDGWR